MKNLALRAYHKVPVFELALYLYVSRDAEKTYNAVARHWGLELGGNFDALAMSDGTGAFAVFFHADKLTEQNIGHEVDHLVNDFMMPYIGQFRCKKCGSESHSHLVGYLQKWIKGRLKRAGLKVR